MTTGYIKYYSGASGDLGANLLSRFDNPTTNKTKTNLQFGRSIALTDTYLAISSSYYTPVNSTLFTNSGLVQVYNPSDGSLLYSFNNPNIVGDAAGDIFGFDIDIDNNYLIVGASGEQYAGPYATSAGSGSAYVYDLTTGSLIRTLNNPNAYSTALNDAFGYSVSISGNYAIVGAYTEDDSTTLTSSGKAYIFDVTTGSLIRTLNNPNAYSTSLNDTFGQGVAISGNYAIVSAWQEDDSTTLTTSGKVYIFDVTTGSLIRTISNPNAFSTSLNDYFGRFVKASGDYVAVGAFGEDINTTTGLEAGYVYVFQISTGSLIRTIADPNAYSTAANDGFGSSSLSIYGDYIVAGATGEDISTAAEGSGRAYVINYLTGAVIRSIADPNAYSTNVSDAFGNKTAISANYFAIAATSEDSALGSASGIVYVYDFNTGNLLYTKEPPSIYNYEYFGGASSYTIKAPSIDVSGNYAIIGAIGYNTTSLGTNDGIAYVVNINTGQLVSTLNNPNAYSTVTNDNFGYSVAISGNYAAVSAIEYADASNPGSGRVYIFNALTGQLLFTVDNPNYYSTKAYDSFGQSMAIDGDYFIVGATGEDINTTTGLDSGKAYIYNITTGTIYRALTNPSAYSTATLDLFGTSVDISGNYAIVGASQEDDASGSASGKAYVFDITTGSSVRTLSNPNAYSTAVSDNFGASVAISGNYAAVSARESEIDSGNAGKVYVYNWSTGTLLYTINNPVDYDTNLKNQGQYFGSFLDINSNYVVVGSPGENTQLGSDAGRVFIYDLLTGNLVLTIDNPNVLGSPSLDLFGFGVAINEANNLVVSAPTEVNTISDTAGTMYSFNIAYGSPWVYKPVKYWNGSQWVQKPLKYWDGSQWVTTV